MFTGCFFTVLHPRFKHNSPLFWGILFSFFLPSLSQAIFFPQILYFWDLRSTLSSREKATSRGRVLGTVLDRVPHRDKKGKSFFSFFWRAKKKVRLQVYRAIPLLCVAPCCLPQERTLKTHTPQIWGVKISPPKFRKQPSKNTVKQVIFEDSPLKFGG